MKERILENIEMLNFLGMDADDRVYVKPFNKWAVIVYYFYYVIQ